MNEEMTFEKAMQRLEEIVKALESGSLTLAEGMALYKEGAVHARFCREKLDKARIELEIWQDGEAVPLKADGEE